MLRRLDQLYGMTVHAEDGDAGTVDDVYFDDETWRVRYLVVDTGGWLSGRRVLISPLGVDVVTWEDLEVVETSLAKEQVENSPDIDLRKPVSRQQMLELHEYYGWPVYWGGSKTLGTAAVGIYPFVMAGVDEIEEEMEEKEDTEHYRGDPHLRSAREVDGYLIHARDGHIGHVDDFFLSEEGWLLRYLVVDTRNWLPGREVMISPDWVERVNWSKKEVYVNLTQDKIENSPELESGQQTVGRNYEEELYEYYGFPRYWA